MKIAILSDTLFEFGGVALQSWEMAHEIEKAGHEAGLIGLDTDGKLARYDLPSVRNIFLISPSYSFSMPGYPEMTTGVPCLGELLRVLEGFEPDVIQLETPGLIGICGLFLSKLLRQPALGAYHTHFPSMAVEVLVRHRKQSKRAGKSHGRQAPRRLIIGGIAHLWMLLFYHMCTGVVVHNKQHRQSMRSYGISSNKISVVPSGIDIAPWQPRPSVEESQEFWRKYGIQEPGPHVFHVGRISGEKGLELLENLELPDTSKLIIVGDGPLMDCIRSRVDAVFLGYRFGTELRNMYRHAGVFVFPSVNDSFARVLFEAALQGVPIIMADEGGAQEYFDDGISCLKFPAEDRHGLEVAIRRLLTDQRLACSIAAEARQLAEQHSWPSTVKQYLAAYRHLTDCNCSAQQDLAHLRQRTRSEGCDDAACKALWQTPFRSE